MTWHLDGALPPLIVVGVALVLVAAKMTGRQRAAVTDAVIVALIVTATGVLEWQMGRPLTYRRGPVRIWSGHVNSDQNSQQVADPYTFTHITHGALFYGATRLLLPSASIGLRAIAAVAVEGAWEAYENTETVIERYRQATISLGYYGDSILNSVCDITACLFGFFLTRTLPKQATWAWVISVEILLALWIRDNLTLNIFMLIRPLAVIKRWQIGG